MQNGAMLLIQLHYATTTAGAEEDRICCYCYCRHPYFVSYKFNRLFLQLPKFGLLIF